MPVLINILRWKINSIRNDKGFTLVEILVAVSMLSLVSVVAIPAVRNYMRNQEIDDSANEVVRLIKQTQSMGISSTSCLGSREYPIGWGISLRSSWVEIKARCREDPLSGSTDTTIDDDSSSFLPASSYRAGSLVRYHKKTSLLAACNSISKLDVLFTPSGIYYRCAPNSNTTEPFDNYTKLQADDVIIANLQHNSLCRRISISAGGNINIERINSTCPST